jgi:predicted amidophosphoribosyltransferase
MIERLLSVVLPQRCAVCSIVGDGVCAVCLAALLRLSPPLCERCGSPGPWPVPRCAECAGRRLAFATARAAVVYEQRARAFVASWKEHGRRDLAAMAADLVAGVVPKPAVAALTFVPADGDRALERGHSPPLALARELGARWGLPVVPLLERTRRVPRQRGLTLAERRSNVRGAFSVAHDVPGGAVGLVDDVYTTGATANACASALRRAGARRVHAVSLARAVR